VRLDCKSFDTLAFDPSYMTRVETLGIPSTLSALRESLSSITSLPVKPEKILLSNYSRRAYGSGEWTVNAMAEGQAKGEVSNILVREQFFQKVEAELFENRLFLHDGGNVGSSTRLINQSAFAKAKEVLVNLSQELTVAAQEGQVLIVSLPVDTNMADNLVWLEYSPRFKMLTIPYQASLDGIKHYVTAVVPKLMSVQTALGTVNFDAKDVWGKLSFSVANSHGSAWQGANLTEAQLNNFKNACKQFAQVVGVIEKLGDNVKGVVTKNQLHVVKLAVADGSGLHFNYHQITNSGDWSRLVIYAAEADIIKLTPVNPASLVICLDELMKSSGDTRSACIAKFD